MEFVTWRGEHAHQVPWKLHHPFYGMAWCILVMFIRNGQHLPLPLQRRLMIPRSKLVFQVLFAPGLGGKEGINHGYVKSWVEITLTWHHWTFQFTSGWFRSSRWLGEVPGFLFPNDGDKKTHRWIQKLNPSVGREVFWSIIIYFFLGFNTTLLDFCTLVGDFLGLETNKASQLKEVSLYSWA